VSESERDVQAGVVGAAGAIGLATLVSRVLGYARDMVVARAFGAGPVTDAFFVAFRIPNLLRRLLAEGALSTAVIPVFTECLTREGRPAFAQVVRAVTGAGTVALGATSALGVLLAPWIVTLMAPGWAGDPTLVSLATGLTRLMFPYLFLVGLAALATGVLNAQRRFLTPALGPAVLNLGMIASVLLLAPRLDPPIYSLAVGVLVGGLGQFLVQLPEAGRAGVSLWPSAHWRHPAVRRIGRLLLPAVFGLATVQITVLVNTLLASLLPGGSVSYLYYADRVMEFPLGVFGIALASAVLPSMSAQAARGEPHALRATLGFSVRLVVFVSVPAAVGLITLGDPIVRLLFQRGAFGPEATAATTRALVAYAVGLPAFSAVRLVSQAFYALGDPRTPVRMAAVALAVNVALAVGLMGPLAHPGLALASSLSAYANVIGLCWLLGRRLGPIGTGEMARSVARTLAASAALALWCWWIGPDGAASWARELRTALAVVSGGLVYVGAAALLGAPELTALLGVVRGGRKGSPPRLP
jgi:putative peptidoglycan lipid II flippase